MALFQRLRAREIAWAPVVLAVLLTAFVASPLIASGALIVSFSIEHIIALWRGEEVVPSWN